jgi:undecaprenyl-diphosphatase
MCYTCLDNLNVINQWATKFVEYIRNPLLDRIMVDVTNIGSPLNIWMVCLCLILILWLHKKYHHVAQFFFSMLCITGVVYAIKFLVKLQRPVGGMISESGYSFASGHAAFAMMFFLLAAYSYRKHIKSVFVKNSLFVLGLLCALLVGFSRVYLGVHYATDVLVGFLIGLAVFAISVLILDSYERERNVIDSQK